MISGTECNLWIYQVNKYSGPYSRTNVQMWHETPKKYNKYNKRMETIDLACLSVKK